METLKLGRRKRELGTSLAFACLKTCDWTKGVDHALSGSPEGPNRLEKVSE